MKKFTKAGVEQRWSDDYSFREKILETAGYNFSIYGYEKTTVSEIAKEMGVPKSSIYKFFNTKQAIGDAICSINMDAMIIAASEAISRAKSATEKLRRLFRTLIELSINLLLDNRQMYVILSNSSRSNWPSQTAYADHIRSLLGSILIEGRASNEFERKTPVDEISRSILQTMQPFVSPFLLQYFLDQLPDAPNEAVGLILRSLAP